MFSVQCSRVLFCFCFFLAHTTRKLVYNGGAKTVLGYYLLCYQFIHFTFRWSGRSQCIKDYFSRICDSMLVRTTPQMALFMLPHCLSYIKKNKTTCMKTHEFSRKSVVSLKKEVQLLMCYQLFCKHLQKVPSLR